MAWRDLEDPIRRDFWLASRSFDDGSTSWDDLHAIIFASPPGTAVFHAGEKGWGTTDYHLAEVRDLLTILAWQNTADAHEKSPSRFPTPVPRPADIEAAKRAAAAPPPTTGALFAGRGGIPGRASVMTVKEFLQRRAAREKRWRERHKKGD